MKKVKCFEYIEAVSQPGKYIIKPVHENFHLDHTEGSFNVICARVMGLSYAQYLRMCRDCFGAELMGKGSYYPIAYFNKTAELLALIDFLNARASLILWQREHPNYEAHAQYVKDKNPIFYNEVTGK